MTLHIGGNKKEGKFQYFAILRNGDGKVVSSGDLTSVLQTIVSHGYDVPGLADAWLATIRTK